ncbi:MAG: hypothetical protein ABI806_26495, partial [Candidatus Solibacter sp.]
DGYYYLYFNLDSLTSDSLLNHSQFVFYLQACCAATPIPISNYEIAFHLLANPSGTCDSLVFPPGDSLPPTCTFDHPVNRRYSASFMPREDGARGSGK